jgi:ferredoxin
MEGNGPGNGDPKRLGLIFASSDCIALDTIITTILGADPQELPVLKVASEDGSGETDPRRINIVGDKFEKCRVNGFRFPKKVVSTNFSAIFPSFIERRLRKAVTSRPQIEHKRCTLCDICIDTCPTGIMTKESKIMIDLDDCISCFCCQEMCPHGAITSKRGWLARFIK